MTPTILWPQHDFERELFDFSPAPSAKDQPNIKKRKLGSKTPNASQENRDSSFADVLEKLKEEGKESEGAFHVITYLFHDSFSLIKLLDHSC